MKKKIVSILAALLAFVTAGSACTDGKDSSSSSEVTEGNKVVYTNREAMLPASVAETGINIAANKKSDYSIVIPKDADSIITFAASEVKNFIRNSSGADIPVVTDEGLEFNAEQKYISIGNTTIFQGCGLTLTKDMGETGYYMKRFGNTLVIAAKNSNGSCSAVYDFLNYTIDLEVYSMDELYYAEKNEVPLLDFDITFIPTVDMRKLLNEAVDTSDVYARRMRLFSWLGAGEWVTFAHTTISKYLPVADYAAEHPDWYNDSQNQVCYSNEEMRLEMEEKIKECIASSEYGYYVMIGHEDNKSMCNCEACVAERELYGGYGGQELNFTNKIAEEMQPWLAENYPDRDIKFVFFAYQTSQTPPISYDETTDTWTPLYEDVSVRENVMVFYCPISADFAHPYNSAVNATEYNELKGWSELFKQAGRSDNIMIWTYSTAATSYFAAMNNFAVPGEHYETMASMGVSYIMDQGSPDSRLPMLEELKVYTMAKMMYRSDYDYNELVNDFIEHYYGVASEEMKEYYHYIRARYKYLNENESFTGRVFSDTTLVGFWPRASVQELMDIIDSALAKVETIKDSDPTRYTTLYNRLKKEKLSPIYLMFSYYMDTLTQDQKEEYWQDLSTYTAMFNIKSTREAADNLQEIIDGWQATIFG